jgi:gliding motility-associated-like protein
LIAADSGLYSIVQTSGGCPTDTFYRNVKIVDLVAKISSKDAACKGDTIQIKFGGITEDTGMIYTWTFLNNAIQRSGPSGGIGYGPYGIEYDTTGNKVVNLVVTMSNFRCTSSDTKTIRVVVAPPVNYEIPKDICINDTVSVSVSDYTLAGSDALYWTWAGANVVSGNRTTGSYQIVFNSTGQKVLTLAVDYQNLCLTEPKLDTVMVHDYPNVHIVSAVDADANKPQICVGDSVLFTVAQYPQYKYSWSPVKEFRPYQSVDNTAWAVLQSAGYVYVRAWDQYNCTAMDSINIAAQPCCGVYLPDAFTPNGDGRNDMFRMITAGHQHIRTFRIVNRYGQTVFQGNSQNTGWDGNFNGVPQDIGTYFWFLSYDCNGHTIEEKGDVTLIR